MIKQPTIPLSDNLRDILGVQLAKTFVARLGDPSQNYKVKVDETDKIGLLYIHGLGDNPNSAYTAENRIGLTELLPKRLVEVGYTETGRFKIIGLAPEDAEFMLGVNVSDNVVVYRDQLIDGGLIPNDSATVRYVGTTYIIGNTPYVTTDQNTGNLIDGSTDDTSATAIEPPSTLGQAIVVLVQINPTTDTLSYKQSTTFPASYTYQLMYANSLLPALDSNNALCGYVILINGLTTIKRERIVSLPDIYRLGGSGASVDVTDGTVTVTGIDKINFDGTRFDVTDEGNDDAGVDIADGGIDTTQLANDAVTNVKIANNSVDTAELVDSAVNSDKLATDAVTNTKIATGAVDSDELATDAVLTAKIANAQVTTDKIADNAITLVKMADNSVDTPELVNDAVDADKLDEADVYTVAGLVLSDSATDGVIGFTPRSTAPTTPTTGMVYLDDGTNRTDSLLGFRRYNGVSWDDIVDTSGISGGSGDLFPKQTIGSTTTIDSGDEVVVHTQNINAEYNINGLLVTDILRVVNNGSAPATPASNILSLYVHNGALFSKNDGGTVIEYGFQPAWSFRGIAEFHTYTGGAWNVVRLDSEGYDAGNVSHDAVNFRFTPVAGDWLIWAYAFNYDDGDVQSLRIYNNTSAAVAGTNRGVESDLSNNDTGMIDSISTVITANGTDAFELQIYKNTARDNARTSGDNYATLFGWKVGT